jgi:hypothetical protein
MGSTFDVLLPSPTFPGTESAEWYDFIIQMMAEFDWGTKLPGFLKEA